MKGKDWFIVGTRLIGLGILFWGFQNMMTFLTRGMLFARLEFALYDTTPPWVYMVNGGLTGAFALVLLLKADAIADWCYGKDKQPGEATDFDDKLQSIARNDMSFDEASSVEEHDR